MTPTEVYDILESSPESAFRFTLSSGDVVEVAHKRFTLMQDLALYIGQTEDPQALSAKRIRVLSLPNIAMVEPIDRRQMMGGRRRRGRR